MRKIRLSKKQQLILILIILAVALFYYLIHKLNSPAYGTIAVPRTNTQQTDTTSYSTLANGYNSLLYPSDLAPDYPPAKADNTLAYDFFKDKKGATLEVYVRNLPAGGVTLDKDYQ